MAPSFGFEMSFVVVLEKATIVYDCTRTPAFRVCPADGEAFTPEVPPGDGYSLEIEHFASAVAGETGRAHRHARAVARDDPPGPRREAVGPRGASGCRCRNRLKRNCPSITDQHHKEGSSRQNPIGSGQVLFESILGPRWEIARDDDHTP